MAPRTAGAIRTTTAPVSTIHSALIRFGAGQAVLATDSATASVTPMGTDLALVSPGASHTRGIGHSHRWYSPGRLLWCATSLCPRSEEHTSELQSLTNL